MSRSAADSWTRVVQAQRNLPVQTAWVSQVSPTGRPHRIGRYFLVR